MTRRKPPEDGDETNVVPIRPSPKKPKKAKTAPRVTRFTAAKKAEYLGHLADGLRRTAAAQAIGLTRWTVRNHRLADPEFAAAEIEAESVANELVEDALFQAAVSGNVTAALAWLYSRDPERWSDRRGAGVAAAMTSEYDLRSMSDEERHALMLETRAELDRRLKLTKTK